MEKMLRYESYVILETNHMLIQRKSRENYK